MLINGAQNTELGSRDAIKVISFNTPDHYTGQTHLFSKIHLQMYNNFSLQII